MKINYLLFFFFLCSFCSCNKKESVSLVNVEIISSQNDILKPLVTPPAFSEVLMIPLETNDSILIGEIVDVQVYDSLIFISDRNDKISVFSIDGKFKNFIGKKGNGQGEYLSIGSFCYDRFNEQVILLDHMKSAYYLYHIDGRSKSVISFNANAKEAPRKIIMLNYNTLLIYYAMYKDNVAYKLFDFIQKKEILIKKYPYLSSNIIYSFSKHPISQCEKSSFLIMPFSDTIYKCADKKVIPQYIVEHSNKMAQIESAEFDKDNNLTSLGVHYIQEGLFVGFNNIFETTDKLLLHYGFYGDNLGYFIADKTTMKGSYHTFLAVENINNTFIDFPELKSMPFFKTVESNSDYFISYVMPYQLITLKGKVSIDGNSVLLKFNQLLNSIHEEDNPVIFLYKLKSDSKL
jgi:hypothetical protein